MKPVIEVVKSPQDESGKPMRTWMSNFSPDDLINRTYLTAPDETGQRFRAKITRKIIEDVEAHQKGLEEHPDRIKFLVQMEGEAQDEIIAYNDIINYLEAELSDDEKIWSFKGITAHEGPLRTSDPSYKGSTYNVQVEWEDGSVTYEPLNVFGIDSPVVCAIYAK